MNNLFKKSLPIVFLLLSLQAGPLSCAVTDEIITIGSVLKLLEDKGYRIGETVDRSPPYIYAREGLLINVNNSPILIYEFTPGLDPKAIRVRKEGLQFAQDILEHGTGYWEIESEDPFYAKDNSNIIFLLGDHPDANALRVLFENNL